MSINDTSGQSMSLKFPWPVSYVHDSVHAEIIDADTEVIVGFEHEVDSTSMGLLCERLGRLMELVSVLPERFDSGSIEAFGIRMGMPARWAATLASYARSRYVNGFARADVLHTAKGFQVLELNIGATVGGVVYSSLPALFGHDQPGNALSAWSEHMANRLGSQAGQGVIIDGTRQPYSPWPRYTGHMARGLNGAGLDCAGVVLPADLVWTGDRLIHHGEQIRWAYPIWSPGNIEGSSDAFVSIMAAIDAQAVVLPIELGGSALSSKASFALLHQLAAEGALNSTDTALIHELVPLTRVVDDALLPDLIAHQSMWVLKPSIGYGGKGVLVGDEILPEEWQRLCHGVVAVGDLEPHVAQIRCHATVNRAHVYSTIGGSRSFDAQAVWGFYLADGRQCGDPVLRARALGGSAVINLATGAATGPMPWPVPVTTAHAS
ncbi:MAG: hypothetical protein ACRCTR_05800 [Actinomycetota bacterium]